MRDDQLTDGATGRPRLEQWFTRAEFESERQSSFRRDLALGVLWFFLGVIVTCAAH